MTTASTGRRRTETRLARAIACVLLAGCAAAAPTASDSNTAAPSPPLLGTDPCPAPDNEWIAMATAGAPDPGETPLRFWSGKELLVLGPQRGAAFEPCANRWRALGMATAPPALLENWQAGQEPVVFGDNVVFLFYGSRGSSSPFDSSDTGAVLQPDRNRWHVLQGDPNAPEPRRAAVVTTSALGLWLWGGVATVQVQLDTAGETRSSGAVLDWDTLRWKPMSAAGAPSPRAAAASAVAADALMIWGGLSKTGPYADECWDQSRCELLADGAVYNMASDSWKRMSGDGAPSARWDMAAAPIRSGMIVFGGKRGRSVLFDGAIYDLARDRWKPLAPFPRGDALDFELEVPRLETHSEHVLLYGRSRVWSYALDGSIWREVPGKIGIGKRVVGPAPPPRPELTPEALEVSWIDAAAARIRTAAMPRDGMPEHPPEQWVWTGHRLIAWGGAYGVPDPDAVDTCRGVTDRPCRTHKAVYDRNGAMISPRSTAR